MLKTFINLKVCKECINKNRNNNKKESKKQKGQRVTKK